jgi:hypothetical protein
MRLLLRATPEAENGLLKEGKVRRSGEGFRAWLLDKREQGKRGTMRPFISADRPPDEELWSFTQENVWV